jgi:hypothetical protein
MPASVVVLMIHPDECPMYAVLVFDHFGGGRGPFVLMLLYQLKLEYGGGVV